ncbi:hypothetical protein J6TS7_34670 [Paenibacillus dendritiformis]|nr:hypothetical protein J6TS7_34670 [Paenibacillus dendritiformis]
MNGQANILLKIVFKSHILKPPASALDFEYIDLDVERSSLVHEKQNFKKYKSQTTSKTKQVKHQPDILNLSLTCTLTQTVDRR